MNITPLVGDVLGYLYRRNQPVWVNDIFADIRRSESSINSTLRALEHAGWVTLSRRDQARYYELTESGRTSAESSGSPQITTPDINTGGGPETSAKLKPAELAAALDEWADCFEHSSAQRVHELTGNPSLRRLAERWTDSMAYSCRRLACLHRGEDPGQAIPQHERRPDLFPPDRACTTAPVDEPLARSA